MPPPTYSIACPKCGGALSPVALDVQTAPWLCNHGCGLGFWSSELNATDLFDPATKSWKYDAQLQVNIASEIADANKRGTSLRDDQLTIADPSILQSVALGKKVDPNFLKATKTHLKNSGH
jgi:chitinase